MDAQISRQIVIVWSVIAFLAGSTAAEDEAARERAAAARLADMDRVAQSCTLTVMRGGTSTECKLIERSVLHYSNATKGAVADGATYLWLDGKRPVAAIALSIRRTGRMFRELTILRGDPLRCRLTGTPDWTPAEDLPQFKVISEAKAPGTSAPQRARQMRALAGEYTANLNLRDGQRTALRLMPQPLYRYSDHESGIVDGAVFSFSEGTDPEVLLIVEGRATSWSVLIARMTSVAFTVTRNGVEVASGANWWDGPKSPKEPYAERDLKKYEFQEQPTQ